MEGADSLKKLDLFTVDILHEIFSSKKLSQTYLFHCLGWDIWYVNSVRYTGDYDGGCAATTYPPAPVASGGDVQQITSLQDLSLSSTNKTLHLTVSPYVSRRF